MKNKFSNHDAMFVKNLKDTKIASDLDIFHTVLDVGLKICQEQLCSSIGDDHATFLVKNALFKEEVV